MTQDRSRELEQALAYARANPASYPHLQAHLPLALELLETLLKDGEHGHAPFDWQDIDINGNMIHARDHLSLVHDAQAISAICEDDLLHACCRLMMAIELREIESRRRAAL